MGKQTSNIKNITSVGESNKGKEIGLQNTHKIHSMACPHGQAMECMLWVFEEINRIQWDNLL